MYVVAAPTVRPSLVERRAVQLGDRRDVDAQVRWPERDALRRLAVHADRRVADDQLDVVDGAVLAQDAEELGEAGDAQPGVAVLVDAQSRGDRRQAGRDRHRLRRRRRPVPHRGRPSRSCSPARRSAPSRWRSGASRRGSSGSPCTGRGCRRTAPRSPPAWCTHRRSPRGSCACSSPSPACSSRTASRCPRRSGAASGSAWWRRCRGPRPW